MKKNTTETPEFKKMQADNRIVKNPVIQAFKTQKLGMVLCFFICWLTPLIVYQLFIFMPTYVSKYLAVSLQWALIVNTISMISIVRIISVSMNITIISIIISIMMIAIIRSICILITSSILIRLLLIFSASSLSLSSYYYQYCLALLLLVLLLLLLLFMVFLLVL